MSERVAIIGVGWAGYQPTSPDLSYKELTYELRISLRAPPFSTNMSLINSARYSNPCIPSLAMVSMDWRLAQCLFVLG